MFNSQTPSFTRFAGLLTAFWVGTAGSCFAGSQTLEQAKSDGVTIAIANEPPYAFMGADGSPTGAGPELDKEILREAGITLFSGAVMEYGAMIPAVQSKRATFASVGSLLITPERCQAVIFSEPLICDGLAFILPNALASKIKNFKDIAAAGLKVGVCGGCVEQKLALEAGNSAEKVVVYPDGTSGMKLLADGRIDVFAYSSIGGADLYDRLADQVKFKYAGVVDFPFSCQGAAFNKEDVELRDAYNKGIGAIRKSGKYMEILKKFKMEEAATGLDTVNTQLLCSR
ncbi:ectoine/hydroxyectoine ABC transporter substrate-binding protein EhuB [Mesorhizobium sp. WSM3862]|uniref:ectoine/hydroxyectoine ABC transporter substrate-binding protein EhuB n=1 Tax=Mesorhizobium sp. WSM3862 TaxID=632858 RepID=UPI000BAEA8C0|nr:ectoine/hydroxyectoine ABC transporter substrate-binding protein EhuB [Mesorhizobium sp. WSM3862]PBB98874.1 ectoine/hydroxyectoine ABC transporter substrate-binding protein EhuB [Mesorhizobium sp. WSM3862]